MYIKCSRLDCDRVAVWRIHNPQKTFVTFRCLEHYKVDFRASSKAAQKWRKERLPCS
jgi:hypothetical protein